MSDNPAAPATQSLVAEIVSAYVRKNQIAPADIPAQINTVYQSLLTAGEAAEPEPEPCCPYPAICPSQRCRVPGLRLARKNATPPHQGLAWVHT